MIKMAGGDMDSHPRIIFTVLLLILCLEIQEDLK